MSYQLREFTDPCRYLPREIAALPPCRPATIPSSPDSARPRRVLGGCVSPLVRLATLILRKIKTILQGSERPSPFASLLPCSPADRPDSSALPSSHCRPSPSAVPTPPEDKTNPGSIMEVLEDIEYYDGSFGTDDCGYRPEVMRLVFALRIAVNHLKWLIAKGVVMSSPSSQTPECLENIRKALQK